MWRGHGRLPELITEQSCRDEIQSFQRHGQKQPVLGRPLVGDPQYKIELIYGARRLFAAQHLNVDLLVEVRDLDDASAFVEMDVENRLRRDWSPYERGIAYMDWIRSGYFSSQRELAAAIGASEAHVSRSLKFAELPSAVTGAFRDLTKIKESWAVVLAERCKDLEVRTRMIDVARRLGDEKEDLEPGTTMNALLDCERAKRKARAARRDTVVRSTEGMPLFRISYRNKDVHIVVPRDHVSTQMIEDVTNVLRDLIKVDPGYDFSRRSRGTETVDAREVEGSKQRLSHVRPRVKPSRRAAPLEVIHAVEASSGR
jgi:ParB family chromosome partitioning protein